MGQQNVIIDQRPTSISGPGQVVIHLRAERTHSHRNNSGFAGFDSVHLGGGFGRQRLQNLEEAELDFFQRTFLNLDFPNNHAGGFSVVVQAAEFASQFSNGDARQEGTRFNGLDLGHTPPRFGKNENDDKLG